VSEDPRSKHADASVDVPHRPGDVGSAEPKRRKPRDKPLVIVLTGDGKGKSSSAFGMLMRSWARGYRCGVFQFVKSAKWRIGEQTVLERLGELHRETGEGGPVEWHKMGAGWSWSRKSGDAEDHAAEAAEGWVEIKRRLAAETHDLLVLDEFTYPMQWGWVDVDDVVRTLADRPGRQHVVVTGRRADPRLIEIADLVTEMTKIKHPMDTGQKGQRGIEW
jgi:cob(I)alamin adenosyltransferase